MDNDVVKPDVLRFAKKKRLSEVVDKLTVLGNGTTLADKENNNITEDREINTPPNTNEQIKQLYSMTPQLASTVPQTHQAIQQTASIVPYQLYSQIASLPTSSIESSAKISPINIPMIGSTVPDLLSVLPETGSTILQNFLLYGGHGDLAHPMYQFNPQAVNLWQFAVNNHQNFINAQAFNSKNAFKGSSTNESIKQEPDDDEEKMVIDETWRDPNETSCDKNPWNIQIKTENERNIREHRELVAKNINEETKTTTYKDPGQPNFNLMPQIAATVPQTHQAIQQTASVSKNHIPIPTVPSQNRNIPTTNPVHMQYSYQYKEQAITGLPNGHDFKKMIPQNMINIPKYIKTDRETIKIEPKIELSNGSTDNESEISWRGSNPSPQSSSIAGDQDQQMPLDLSIKGKIIKKESKARKSSKKLRSEPKRSPSQDELYPEVRGDVASPTTRETVAARYNMEVSPVVEQMPDGSDRAWACPVCGQLFSQKDRLAKHVACRHRGRSPSRTHVCWSCNRGFSRSDMLTRHLRLHTGQKPYRCGVCGQIFSRSDHLATHRRTHTGEKPYKCPQCSYSACRRDMITRHMRTHRTPISSSPPPPNTTSPPAFPAVHSPQQAVDL